MERSIVLVGLMGSGKSSVGWRLAEYLGVDFVDVDAEIEKATGLSIADFFTQYDEDEFRTLEHRVLTRLLNATPQVIATGGGAFVRKGNQELIKSKGVSVWLDASLETLWERVRHKKHRPLLTNSEDPKTTLTNLLTQRNPEYAKADYRVLSKPDQPHEKVIEQICNVLGIDLEIT